MALLWSQINRQAALSTRIAMAWEERNKGYGRDRAMHVRDAGFAGLVGNHPDTLRERYDATDRAHPDPYGSESFSASTWDDARPEMTPQEQAHYDEYDEPTEDFDRRHNDAYEKLWHERHGEGNPDHHDDDLLDFVDYHGDNQEFWKKNATHGPVDLRKGVYATQSHVHPDHIAKYHDNPDAQTHHIENGKLDTGYLGDSDPMFVTHQGRLHATEGHHRVAAALQRGDSHINGWHYDADQHGFPSNDDDDDWD